MRYFHTNQLSNGYAAVGSAIQLVQAERSYDQFLPSMNLVLEVTPKFITRFGAAKTIARPSLASLTPGGDISVQGGNRNFSSGNPDLKPTTSKNLDLSFEWYPTGGAIYSVGLFYKDISTFVQTLRQTIPFNQLGLPNELLNGTIATPTDDFDVTQPVNSSGGTLKGWRSTSSSRCVSSPGFLSDFGVLLNYTYVDLSIKYLTSTTAGAPTVDATLVGLSKHAANGTLYYENDKFSIRGSVSYRSGYFTQVPGRNSNFVEGTNSTLNVDARASYNINKQFQVSLEAINLTNQPEDRYVDYSDRPWIYSKTGRTVALGLALHLLISRLRAGAWYPLIAARRRILCVFLQEHMMIARATSLSRRPVRLAMIATVVASVPVAAIGQSSPTATTARTAAGTRADWPGRGNAQRPAIRDTRPVIVQAAARR